MCWDHVGLTGVRVQESNGKKAANSIMARFTGRNKRDVDSSVETVVFCDLGHIKKCAISKVRRKWVEECFDFMVERMGKEANRQSLIKTEDLGSGET